MGASMEMKYMNDRGVSSAVSINEQQKTPSTTVTEVPSADQRDAQALSRLGKKPVLKVCAEWMRAKALQKHMKLK